MSPIKYAALLDNIVAHNVAMSWETFRVYSYSWKNPMQSGHATVSQIFQPFIDVCFGKLKADGHF